MRDAFGGAFMIKIFLISIIVYVCFTALALNYAKAFKVKNKIIDYLENNEISIITDMNASAFENMEKYFDYILTADQIKRSKPAPDVFLQIAEKLNISPSNCIVIEDTLAGVQAAKSANMYTFAINEKESLPDKKEIQKLADRYIYSLNEVKLP